MLCIYNIIDLKKQYVDFIRVVHVRDGNLTSALYGVWFR